MKSSQRATSAVDTRGFVYELAPYLQKQEWQLERLENQLANANRQFAEARARRDELDEDFEYQMRSLRKWMYPNPNPQAYQRGF
jgi:chromosome segregation ATPase